MAPEWHQNMTDEDHAKNRDEMWKEEVKSRDHAISLAMTVLADHGVLPSRIEETYRTFLRHRYCRIDANPPHTPK